MSSLKVGSLFAGIGGFDLGLTWAGGYEIAWQVELDQWCRRVLQKHWPDAERFADIRDCGIHNLSPVDVIAGGFPCQDISVAGTQKGLEGERSSLWWQMRRIVGELRPRYVLIENVPNLLIRGFDRVLGSLSEIGYDAEWGVISANDVGAPHLRQRLWIVAYPESLRELQSKGGKRNINGRISHCREEGPLAYPDGDDGRGASSPVSCGRHPRVEHRRGGTGLNVSDSAQEVAYPDGTRFRERCGTEPMEARHLSAECGGASEEWQDRYDENWAVEPDVGRVAHGIPRRMDRLRGLGNAIVPQIACLLGQRINQLITLESA
jgi:DNA (cytosine-5)-methyltransferase 1